MHCDQTLSELRDIIQRKLQDLANKTRPESLYEPIRYALAQPGKQLRPILLLLCNEAVGGSLEDAVDAAAAIEVIHTFTLVHDDIMDHDELRRGRQTVSRRWDENVAILAGDGLLVMGYERLAHLPPRHLPVLLRLYSRAILEVCEGQALDKAFELRDAISLPEYYEMIEKKTGRLFALACEAGAILGNGNPAQVTACKKFGAALGRAFQLQDDLLDVIGDEQTLGKDVGSDLEEGKKTFLLTHARMHANPQQRQELDTLCSQHPLHEAAIREIIQLFDELGTLAAAQHEIDACLTIASSQLGFLPSSNARQNLAQLLLKLARRNH